MVKTRKWDIYEHLKTEEDIRGFIEAYMEEAKNDADPGYLLDALAVAARARGMLKVSRDTGLDRTGLYRSVRKGGNPTIGALWKVARNLGYRLTLAPIDKKAA